MSWALTWSGTNPNKSGAEREGGHADERLRLLASASSPNLHDPHAIEFHVIRGRQQNLADGIHPIHDMVEKGLSLELLAREIGASPGSVHAIAKHGWTPLHFACWRGRLDFVQVLVEKGNADVTVRDEFGWTPFHCAVEKAHVEICSYLLRRCHEQLQVILKSANALSPNVQRLVEQLQKRAT